MSESKLQSLKDLLSDQDVWMKSIGRYQWALDGVVTCPIKKANQFSLMGAQMRLAMTTGVIHAPDCTALTEATRVISGNTSYNPEVWSDRPEVTFEDLHRMLDLAIELRKDME